MTDQDLDQPLDEYKTVPTWDYPGSSACSGDEGDPSCPRMIIELWSSPPPRPVRMINDIEVASVDEQPTDPDQLADDQPDQGAPPELDDPDKTLDLPPDAPDQWQPPIPTRDASDEPARDPDAVESKQQLPLEGKLEVNFALIIYIDINIIKNYFSFFSWRGGRF